MYLPSRRGNASLIENLLSDPGRYAAFPADPQVSIIAQMGSLNRELVGRSRTELNNTEAPVQTVDLGRRLIYQELLYVTIKTDDPQPAHDLQPQVGMGSVCMIDEVDNSEGGTALGLFYVKERVLRGDFFYVWIAPDPDQQ